MANTCRKLVAIVGGCLAAVMLPAQPCQASLVVNGTGTGTGTPGQALNVRATFDFTTHNFGAGAVDALKITLENLGPDPTMFRGNLITGLFFNFVGVGALDTTSTGFDGLAPSVFTTTGGATVSNKDIAPAINNTATDGTFQLSNGPFGLSNGGVSYSAYSHGISTVGAGLTGFNGSAVNGDDYGIATTDAVLTNDGLPSALPVINGSAMFWLKKTTDMVSLSQIDKVRFSFGSKPDHQISVAVPEPSAFLFGGMVSLAVGGVITLRRKLSR
jgi:hypothetical protein